MKKFGIEIRRADTITGLYQDIDRVLADVPYKSVTKEIQIQTIAHALQKMLKVESHLSICTIDRCIEISQVHISKERYQIYDTMHCVHWNEMTDEFRATLIAMILDDFRTILNYNKTK